MSPTSRRKRGGCWQFTTDCSCTTHRPRKECTMDIAERPISGTAPESTPVATDDEVDADQVEQAIAALGVGHISLGESMRVAFASLRGNALRTLLTSLGVIIGVTAVVALLAIGRGSQDA